MCVYPSPTPYFVVLVVVHIFACSSLRLGCQLYHDILEIPRLLLCYWNSSLLIIILLYILPSSFFLLLQHALTATHKKSHKTHTVACLSMAIMLQTPKQLYDLCLHTLSIIHTDKQFSTQDPFHTRAHPKKFFIISDFLSLSLFLAEMHFLPTQANLRGSERDANVLFWLRDFDKQVLLHLLFVMNDLCTFFVLFPNACFFLLLLLRVCDICFLFLNKMHNCRGCTATWKWRLIWIRDKVWSGFVIDYIMLVKGLISNFYAISSLKYFTTIYE